ncbi:MAG: tol-pal system protein YbgF [Pseudomonadota bacterium]|nr:tol-pal system protein YbgF [Pseudomonadota bacterium]
MTARNGTWRFLSAACLVAAAVSGCATTPPDEDPVQIKLKDLDMRLARIERVVSNQSLLDLANQVEALRSDVRAMHNDIDIINHNLESARKQQHDLYADLDQRLKSLETRGGAAAAQPAGTGAAGAAGAQPAADQDKASYQAAFDLLKDGQYDRAIAAFQSFLASNPKSQYADNAQYWLGEAYYVNKSFPESLAAFQRVVENYPQSRKVPDALLKIGYCNYELMQFTAARQALSEVATKFPDSASGHLAQQRLDKMTAEKH